jgi:hypothetical protein
MTLTLDQVGGAVVRVEIAESDGSSFVLQLARDRPALLIEFSPHLLRECGSAPEQLLATLQALYPDIRLFEQAGRPAVPLDARAAQTLLTVTYGSRNLLCAASR